MEMFQLNARGEITSEVMVWLVVVLAIGMVLVWYIGNLYLYRQPIEKSAADARNIADLVNQGCNLAYFNASYNPVTETGNLSVANSTICINNLGASSCYKTACNFNYYNTTIDLSTVTEIYVINNGQIQIYGS